MSTDLAIGIAGAGGDGVILLGELLAQAAAKVGLHAILTKSFGPQIRGGESSSRVRVSDHPLTWAGDKVDALLLFHWDDLARFKSELVFKKNAQIIVDEADETPEDQIPIAEYLKNRVQRIPFEQIAVDATGIKRAKNMVMAGVACGLFNWPEEGIEEYIKQRFAKQGEEVVATNLKAVLAGKDYAQANLQEASAVRLKYQRCDPLVFISGNDAVAYGALCAGCRFMAGYPITPASEILEWMARELPRFDGVCVQAEDEISAACMAIGASYGGVKAITATSGPGLSLKQEAIGLAVLAEIPLVVVDTQRGGPSTGMPTRTEQSDLNIAIYGGHGDCPRVVLAATNIDECYELAHTAFDIAERYQTPVILLLDQFLGHSIFTLSDIEIHHHDPKREHTYFIAKYRPDMWDERFGSIEEYLADPSVGSSRRVPEVEELRDGFNRYKLTDDGVSPMSMPAMPGGEYTAVGIEHGETSLPSSSHIVHQAQSEKRFRKFEQIARNYALFDSCGVDHPKLGVLTWGSTFGVCEEICALFNNAGLPTQVLAPQILYPLPWQQIQSWLDGLEQLVTIETNYGNQFYHYIKAFLDLPDASYHYSRAGGIPMYLSEVLNFIMYNITLPADFKHEIIEERLSW